MAKGKAMQMSEPTTRQEPRYERKIKAVTRKTMETSGKEKRVDVLFLLSVCKHTGKMA